MILFRWFLDNATILTRPPTWYELTGNLVIIAFIGVVVLVLANAR